MSLIGRLWYGRAAYAADENPYRARLGNVTVEAVRTFNALLNTFSHTFDFRHDEALRVDPQFALKMRRDPFLRALLQERLMPLTRWKWQCVPEDPTHKSQLERAKWYEACLRKTPRFSKQKLYLGHASWYGRYGSQIAFGRSRIKGQMGWHVCQHVPVNGDKLVFDWNGATAGVRINQQATSDYPRENITYDNRGTPILMLRDPEVRQQFIIHVHELDDADYFEPEMAGRICGIGLRDFAYYGAFLRSRMIQWATAFMEKIGTLGLLIFYYPEGNAAAKSQAEMAARASSNKSALAVPIPKGGDKKTSSAELLPANMTGVQFLVDIISGWWERNIERLFVGQSMSSGEGGGNALGSADRASLAKDTKFNLLQFDAIGEEETYTTDLMPKLCELNGDAGWDLQFRFMLPDPEAEAKLTSITKAATLPGKKLEYKADEVRDITGMSEPGPDDKVVGGDAPQPGMGPDGQPLPPGGPGAPPGGLPGGGLPAPKPGDPSAPSPGGVPGADFDPDGQPEPHERWADPHPEAEALSLAMVKAAEEGDDQALDDLRELATDPDALHNLMSDLDAGEPTPEEAQYLAYLRTVPYGWIAAQSRAGGVKAIGNGPHSGKTLYGKQAEAALRAQQRGTEAGPPVPTKRQRAQADAATRKREGTEKKGRAVTAVQKATTDPKSLTPEELGSLADHLKTLTVSQLKAVARQVKEKVSGPKQQLADRLLNYVRTRSTTPAAPAPQPEPKAEPNPAPQPPPLPPPPVSPPPPPARRTRIGAADAAPTDDEFEAASRPHEPPAPPAPPPPPPAPAPVPVESRESAMMRGLREDDTFVTALMESELDRAGALDSSGNIRPGTDPALIRRILDETQGSINSVGGNEEERASLARAYRALNSEPAASSATTISPPPPPPPPPAPAPRFEPSQAASSRSVSSAAVAPPSAPPIPPKNVLVRFSGNEAQTRQVATRLFGSDAFSNSALASAANAGDGAHVNVEENSDHLILSTSGNGYYAMRTFHKEADGGVVVHNDIFRVKYKENPNFDPAAPKNDPRSKKWVKENPDVNGTELLANQVRSLRALGVKHIETSAARAESSNPNQAMNGYYTWPRLGYDATIPRSDWNALPDHLKQQVESNPTGSKTKRSILDLFHTEEGRKYWKEHGGWLDCKFDLSDDSLSMRTLTKYLAERRGGDE